MEVLPIKIILNITTKFSGGWNLKNFNISTSIGKVFISSACVTNLSMHFIFNLSIIFSSNIVIKCTLGYFTAKI